MPHTSFDTPLGTCAVSWGERGLTRFHLPGDTRPAAHDAESGADLPVWIQDIIARVQRHLGGDFQDFSDLTYDFAELPEFTRAVLLATLAVKAGRTVTYGDLASALGQPPAASRAVGAALGANPWPLLIPCHRVVATSGKMTGYSGPGGIETKTRLLALEGAQLL
jgi:methylated-DNA-[protein]-cysteine S-methyltransferase